MGMKIHLKNRETEQILPKIQTFFETYGNIVYHGKYFFRVIYEKMSEGFRKDVGRRKSLKYVGRQLCHQNSFKLIQTLTYSILRLIIFFELFLKRCRNVLEKTSVGRIPGRTSVGRKIIWRQKVSPNELKILEMVKHNK